MATVDTSKTRRLHLAGQKHELFLKKMNYWIIEVPPALHVPWFENHRAKILNLQLIFTAIVINLTLLPSWSQVSPRLHRLQVWVRGLGVSERRETSHHHRMYRHRTSPPDSSSWVHLLLFTVSLDSFLLMQCESMAVIVTPAAGLELSPTATISGPHSCLSQSHHSISMSSMGD